MVKSCKIDSLKLLFSLLTDMRETGAKYIGMVLQNNKTLKSLELKRNLLGINGIKYISEALKVNQTLIFLDISFNAIYMKIGGKYLSEMLKKNKTLTTLELLGNQTKPTDIIYFNEALCENQTLTKLSLRRLYKPEFFDLEYLLMVLNANIDTKSRKNHFKKEISTLFSLKDVQINFK